MSGKGKEPGRIPTREECIDLLRNHGCDDHVVKHCVAVANLARKIAGRCRVNTELVEAGALLHDIGRCKTHGMDHAVIGARLAKQLGLHQAIVGMIERHIGGGLTRAESKQLGLPMKNYFPKTVEEKIVAHSDNLMDGDRKTSVAEAVSQLVRKGEHEAAKRVLELHRELSELCHGNVDHLS